MTKEKKEDTEVVESLSPRIHIDEFVSMYTELNDMQKAGFKVSCRKVWMRKKEWDEAFSLYQGK